MTSNFDADSNDNELCIITDFFNREVMTDGYDNDEIIDEDNRRFYIRNKNDQFLEKVNDGNQFIIPPDTTKFNKYPLVGKPTNYYQKILPSGKIENVSDEKTTQKNENEIYKDLSDDKGLKLFANPPKKNYKLIFNKIPIFEKTGKNVKKSDKYRPENIRKRIKSNFYNQILNNLNTELKNLKVEGFVNFPQEMITDVSKIKCKIYLERTLKEQMIEPPQKEKQKDCEKSSQMELEEDNEMEDPPNLKNNDNFLKCLEANEKIIKMLTQRKISLFDKILGMKIEDIYNCYLKSEKFEDSIKELMKEENSNYEYIKKYIDVANDIINYYKPLNANKEIKSSETKKATGSKSFSLKKSELNN